METCCGCFFVQKCVLSRSFNYAVTILIFATGFCAVQSTSNSVSVSSASLKLLFTRIFSGSRRSAPFDRAALDDTNGFRIRAVVNLLLTQNKAFIPVLDFNICHHRVLLLLSQPERTPAAATARAITPALFRKLRRVMLVIFLHLISCFASSCFPLRISTEGG